MQYFITLGLTLISTNSITASIIKQPIESMKWQKSNVDITKLLPENDFPDVEYPNNILDSAKPYYFSSLYKEKNILSPFSDDVKTTFNVLAAPEQNKKQKETLSLKNESKTKKVTQHDNNEYFQKAKIVETGEKLNKTGKIRGISSFVPVAISEQFSKSNFVLEDSNNTSVLYNESASRTRSMDAESLHKDLNKFDTKINNNFESNTENKIVENKPLQNVTGDISNSLENEQNLTNILTKEISEVVSFANDYMNVNSTTTKNKSPIEQKLYFKELIKEIDDEAFLMNYNETFLEQANEALTNMTEYWDTFVSRLYEILALKSDEDD